MNENIKNKIEKFENINPFLLTDFYKTVHHLAYVPKMEYLTSYWTPRKSRIENVDKVVMFGLQAFIKKYLIYYFDKNFFNTPWNEIEKEYKRTIINCMNEAASDTTELKKLHDLGYLPLRISAVDEGERVNIKTPMIEITNTVAGFGWLVNYLETTISCNIWHPMTTATIGYEYRKFVNRYFNETVSDVAIKRVDIIDGKFVIRELTEEEKKNIKLNNIENTACGDFSMRGMTSPESAVAASAGHELSFSGTATIASNNWNEAYYNCDITKERIGIGVPSMEHSVMESYGKENEFECYRHLIEDVPAFRKGPLSIVSDTWDYWNVLTNYIPKLKDSIMKRDGKIIVRGDSGDPIDIICGELKGSDYIVVDNLTEEGIKDYFKYEAENTYPWNGTSESYYNVRINDYLYKVTCEHAFETDEDNEGYYTSTVEEVYYEKIELTPAMKGTVEILWDIFGGYINEKGYKVLDPHIGAIYGDSITLERGEAIYKELKEKGFAVNNCTLGIGSFTYNYLTRDSLGFALKATDCIVDGTEFAIFKDPITDKSKGNNFKKSQKGKCYVYRSGEDILYKDELTIEDLKKDEYKDNLLTTVYEDGKLIKDFTLTEIRNRLHKNNF